MILPLIKGCKLEGYVLVLGVNMEVEKQSIGGEYTQIKIQPPFFKNHSVLKNEL